MTLPRANVTITGSFSLTDTAGPLKALSREDMLPPLIVTSLYEAMDDPHLLAYRVAEPTDYVLLGLFEIICFRQAAGDDAVSVHDVACFAADGYLAEDQEDCAAIFAKHGVLCSSDMLVSLAEVCLKRLEAGVAVTVNVRSGEIEAVTPVVHPHAFGLASVTPRTLVERTKISITRGASEIVGVRDVERNLIHGAASQIVGFIRMERLAINRFSLPSKRTWLSLFRGEETICGGTHLTASLAALIGTCEAVERFQVAYRSPTIELAFCAYKDFADICVNPAALFYPSKAAQNPLETPMYWAACLHMTEHRVVLVPAQELWFDTRRLENETTFVRNTTSGSAVGSSFVEAAVFASFEAVERDAFLVS